MAAEQNAVDTECYHTLARKTERRIGEVYITQLGVLIW